MFPRRHTYSLWRISQKKTYCDNGEAPLQGNDLKHLDDNYLFGNLDCYVYKLFNEQNCQIYPKIQGSCKKGVALPHQFWNGKKYILWTP